MAYPLASLLSVGTSSSRCGGETLVRRPILRFKVERGAGGRLLMVSRCHNGGKIVGRKAYGVNFLKGGIGHFSLCQTGVFCEVDGLVNIAPGKLTGCE